MIGTGCHYHCGRCERASSAYCPPNRFPPAMTRSYIRVIVIWLITLAALYALQEYFS